jgi:small conductance mechanosensitive channel
MKTQHALHCLLLLACVVFSTATYAVEQEISRDLQELLQPLEQNISELQILDKRIGAAPQRDREALIYRRDTRGFEVLQQLDQLVNSAAQLPADDPGRRAVQQRLHDDMGGAGSRVLARIGELGQRIADHYAQLDSLSGTELITTQAYIQSLEVMRFGYYDALVSVIEGRQALGIPAEDLARSLLAQLNLQAQTLLGRIEFAGGALEEVQGRLQQDPDNADVAATVVEMSRLQRLDFGRLEIMIGLLERLGEDATDYQTVLLQQGEGLSIAVLETSVLMELIEDGWATLRQFSIDNGPDLMFRLLIILLILLAFRTLSRLTKRGVRAACERPEVDISTLLKDVLVSVCGGTVMVIGILMALSQMGISLGPMLAGLGVAGFVVGFALQDTLGNFAAGGMILMYRPYDVDDFVEVAGASGLVKKMSLVSTTIATFDNQILVVPNNKIWGDVIKNVTAQKVRRVDLEFGIGYGDDIEHAERIMESILRDHDKVLSKPESMVKLQALADSSVNFVVRPWVETEDYWDVYWDITREVKMRFDREGISIPFPQRDVHYYNPSDA